jgi:hypothetical protein
MRPSDSTVATAREPWCARTWRTLPHRTAPGRSCDTDARQIGRSDGRTVTGQTVHTHSTLAPATARMLHLLPRGGAQSLTR